MRVQICKWGHSLAVRIPSSVIAKAKVKEGSQMEVTVQKTGTIALIPMEAMPTLHELMDAVTRTNLHRETQTGPVLGNELW
jgi:antitoxin MazE